MESLLARAWVECMCATKKNQSLELVVIRQRHKHTHTSRGQTIWKMAWKWVMNYGNGCLHSQHAKRIWFFFHSTIHDFYRKRDEREREDEKQEAIDLITYSWAEREKGRIDANGFNRESKWVLICIRNVPSALRNSLTSELWHYSTEKHLNCHTKAKQSN